MTSSVGLWEAGVKSQHLAGYLVIYRHLGLVLAVPDRFHMLWWAFKTQHFEMIFFFSLFNGSFESSKRVSHQGSRVQTICLLKNNSWQNYLCVDERKYKGFPLSVCLFLAWRNIYYPGQNSKSALMFYKLFTQVGKDCCRLYANTQHPRFLSVCFQLEAARQRNTSDRFFLSVL